MAINLIGLQRRRQCMRYVVCVCHVGVLAGGLADWPDGGRAAACVPPAVHHVGACGQGWIRWWPGRNTTIYTRYTRLITRGGKYTLSVALPFIINYWQHLQRRRRRQHDEQLSKVKNTTVWLQILLCVCVSGWIDVRIYYYYFTIPPRPRTRCTLSN